MASKMSQGQAIKVIRKNSLPYDPGHNKPEAVSPTKSPSPARTPAVTAGFGNFARNLGKTEMYRKQTAAIRKSMGPQAPVRVKQPAGLKMPKPNLAKGVKKFLSSRKKQSRQFKAGRKVLYGN